MKIELTHEITLQKGYAFLEIEVLHETEDMAAFLESIKNGEQLFDEALQKRAEKEMKNLGFMDESGITKKGEELIETKKRYIRECGKYEIDFIEDDELFENRIFYIKRTKPQNDTRDLEEINFNDTYFILDDTHHASDKIKLSKTFIERVNGNHKAISYSRFYEFKGNGLITDRERINDQEHKEKESFLRRERFKYFYENILGNDYDSGREIYKIDYDEAKEFMQNSGDKTIPDIRTLCMDFKAVNYDLTIAQIPLEPKSKEDAQGILTLCLLEDLKERHHTEQDLGIKREYYCNNTSLNNFSVSAQNSVGALENEIQKKTRAYWHYYTAKDLVPKKDFFSAINHITLQHNAQMSYKDIIDRVKQERYIQKFIYIDQYFKNIYQHQKARLFVEGFGAEQSLIITSPENQGALQSLGLECRTCRPMPHDRYFILGIENEIEVWSITQSDILKFEQKASDLELGTMGTSRGCTLSNLGNKLETPPSHIQNIIKEYMGS